LASVLIATRGEKTEIYLHPHRDAKRKAAELLEKQLPIGNLNGEKLALQG
jgi:hypothetical protein